MKKIGLIILVVVLALGAIGAGYAAWSQSLYVNGSVQNGKLQAGFTDVTPPVDIANVTASASNYAFTNDVMTVNIGNAYPGMSETIYFKVYNYGTIPETVTLTTTSPLPAWLHVVTTAPSGAIAPANYSGWGTIVVSVDSWADNSVQNALNTFQVVLTANQ